jgi:predicted enzyme related to lactoylglutathione lyase
MSTLRQAPTTWRSIGCWSRDVDGWATSLEELGVTIIAKPKTHRDGARSCYIQDPDGNTIQIIHHPPISGA